VGAGLPAALEASIDRAVAARPTELPRIAKQIEARRRTAATAPGALYGSLRNAIEQGVQGIQAPVAAATAITVSA